jgi:diguanylate cyclase (GGDEF)-like protein/PAS domain S-box-containing protein
MLTQGRGVARVMTTVIADEDGPGAGSPFAQLDARYSAVFDAVNDGIFISNPNTGRFIEVNQSGCKMFGYDKAEIIGRDIEMLSSGVHPYTQEVAIDKAQRAHLGEPQSFEWQCRTKNNVLFWAEISVQFTEFGPTPAIVANVRDLTERKRQSARITTAFDLMSQGLCMFNADKELIVCNEQYARMYGIPPEHLQPGTPFRQILQYRLENGQFDDPEHYVLERTRAVEEQTASVKIQHLADGRTIAISHRPMPGGGWVATHDDITGIRRIEAKITHLAHHDGLTDLPNRVLFREELDGAITQSLRTGELFAVLLLDLDQFKNVNDTRGHLIGDRLLRLVAERLRADLRVTEKVFRFGGDEFAILLGDSPDPAQISALADRLIDSISRPYAIDGIEVHVGASIGVATYRQDVCDADTLMTHADTALYLAKTEGRGNYQFYSDAMNEEIRSRVALSDQLRLAIPGGQLFVAYQPQVTAQDGRIVGVEALVRWRHPEHGVLMPESFLPVAQSSGLMVAIDQWVLRQACRQGRQWIDAGLAPGTICVNLSSAQFKNPLALESFVFAVLEETQLPAQQLEVEITESTFIDFSCAHREMIQRLRDAGVRFSLDDFGTGYSSLSYLRRFPVDRIKIAQEFVSDLASSTAAATIVQFILSLSRSLDSKVIAEGVETPEQLELLQEWGCHDVQGFYFAAPMTAEAILPLLSAGTISRRRGPEQRR